MFPREALICVFKKIQKLTINKRGSIPEMNTGIVPCFPLCRLSVFQHERRTITWAAFIKPKFDHLIAPRLENVQQP